MWLQGNKKVSNSKSCSMVTWDITVTSVTSLRHERTKLAITLNLYITVSDTGATCASIRLNGKTHLWNMNRQTMQKIETNVINVVTFPWRRKMQICTQNWSIKVPTIFVSNAISWHFKNIALKSTWVQSTMAWNIPVTNVITWHQPEVIWIITRSQSTKV